jgi:hypothetical protein
VLTWTTGDRLLVTICAGCFLMRPSPPESDSDGILSELFVEPTERWLSATSHLLGVTHAFGGVQDATRTWRIDRIRSAPGKPAGWAPVARQSRRADVHKKLTFAVASVASGKVPAPVRVRLKEGDEHDDGIAGGDSPRVPARFAVDDARAFLHRALRFW